MAAGGARACRGRPVPPPWYIGWWRPCPSCGRRKPSCRRSWWPCGRGWLSATVSSKPRPRSCRTRYLGRVGRAEATAHCETGRRTLPRVPGTLQITRIWTDGVSSPGLGTHGGLGLLSWSSVCHSLRLPGGQICLPQVTGSVCRHGRSGRAQGCSCSEAGAESSPSSKGLWLGEPTWTKLIAEVAPWKTGRR